MVQYLRGVVVITMSEEVAWEFVIFFFKFFIFKIFFILFTGFFYLFFVFYYNVRLIGGEGFFGFQFLELCFLKFFWLFNSFLLIGCFYNGLIIWFGCQYFILMSLMVVFQIRCLVDTWVLFWISGVVGFGFFQKLYFRFSYFCEELW